MTYRPRARLAEAKEAVIPERLGQVYAQPALAAQLPDPLARD
jgi:hypothetical protein